MTDHVLSFTMRLLLCFRHELLYCSFCTRKKNWGLERWDLLQCLQARIRSRRKMLGPWCSRSSAPTRLFENLPSSLIPRRSHFIFFFSSSKFRATCSFSLKFVGNNSLMWAECLLSDLFLIFYFLNLDSDNWGRAASVEEVSWFSFNDSNSLMFFSFFLKYCCLGWRF